MSKKYFDVNVKVLEGSHISGKNLSTQVCIQVGGEKRYSKVVYHQSKPFFDEYFVFTVFMDKDEFLDTIITISALEKRKCVKVRRLIGCISLDIATIWNEPGRQLKKWFALTLPSDRSAQKKAFVECDLKIAVASEYLEVPSLTIVPLNEMVGNRRARYKILVHHCTGLRVQSTKKVPKVIVKVLYAGKTGSTTKKVLKDTVDWNEEIVFIEFFPPMRQNLTVQLCTGKNVIGVRDFKLYEFFKIFKGGFLNMFGPAYIHLYAEKNLYRGSLLLGIESELLGVLGEFEKLHGITRKVIEPISEIKYGILKEFVCFGICFDVVITKENCGKDNIYLSLEMGKSEIVESQRYSAISSDQDLYLPFGEKKPCFSVLSEWPDCTHRLYNTNLVASLAKNLKEDLDLAYAFQSRGCEIEAKILLHSSLQKLAIDSKTVLHLFSKGRTELDSKRASFLRKQVGLLAKLQASDTSLDNVFLKCELFLEILDRCYEDVQDSLPSLLITLRQNETTVGTCLLHSRLLIFSESQVKRGQNSAKINNLIFHGKEGEIVGRIKIWLWLGKKEEINYCKELLPPGYTTSLKESVKTDDLTLPSSLIYHASHKYNAICHIYSGYIDEKEVNEGQCDSYVKVCFANNFRNTTIAKRSLAPIWKETLTLPGVKIYSSPEYLMKNSPSMTVQMWDGSVNPHKMLGTRQVTCTVRPNPLTKVPEFNLKWWNIGRDCEVLVACELIGSSAKNASAEVFGKRSHTIIPRLLESPPIPYRLEVVFWGMRPLYPRALKNIVQPQVTLQLSTAEVSSGVISRASTVLNFQHDTRIISLKLPGNKIYSPPLLIKIMSNVKYLTSIAEKNIYRYEYQLPTKSLWETLSGRRTPDRSLTSAPSHRVAMPDLIPQTEVTGMQSTHLLDIREIPNTIRNMVRDSIFMKMFQSPDTASSEDSSDDEIEQDWWDRYYKGQIKIYNTELENQKRFSGFTDFISTFAVNQRNDKGGNSTEICKLKAIINLYKWPLDEPVVTMQGQDPGMGVLKLSELKSSVNILVRVYCVSATDLYPSDMNGKSDPYIEIATPSKTVSDSINKILGELNPVFGNSHEIIATLPTDSLLAVRVMDWDAFSKDDLIGETIIDIENRFYSKHRCTCGLPQTYSKVGANGWRDIETPSKILERMCNTHNLPLPQYQDKSVFIGAKEFVVTRASSDREENQEKLALAALNNWNEMPIVGCPLVEEHVETRLLFTEGKPGLVRGKLKMWVDMFDMSLGNVPLPINIAPRTPQPFELRVNILNTAKIPLVDLSTLEGKNCTDILVRGWLGDPERIQTTDIHYESYTGTGNFNWRFVFPFLYYRKEKKMVFYKKNLFDIGKKEIKVPAVINLEVCDSEGLLEDTFIGGMMLELCRMPKGAQSLKTCAPHKVFDPSNYVDLFRVESLRGWWPFLAEKTIMKDTGFLEAEFFLLTAEEARRCPVGLGRSPPDPLPVPERASGRKSPWRVLLGILGKLNCQKCGGHTLTIIILMALIGLIAALIYILPSTIDKLKPWFQDTV